jgi:hypothetical protein
MDPPLMVSSSLRCGIAIHRKTPFPWVNDCQYALGRVFCVKVTQCDLSLLTTLTRCERGSRIHLRASTSNNRLIVELC